MQCPYIEDENSTGYIGKLNRELGCYLEVPAHMTRMSIALLGVTGTFFGICTIDLEKIATDIFSKNPSWSPEFLFRIDFTGPAGYDSDSPDNA